MEVRTDRGVARGFELHFDLDEEGPASEFLFDGGEPGKSVDSVNDRGELKLATYDPAYREESITGICCWTGRRSQDDEFSPEG